MMESEFTSHINDQESAINETVQANPNYIFGKSFHWNRQWLIVVLVVLVLVLAGGVFALYISSQEPQKFVPPLEPTSTPIVQITPTIDETSNWKTYRNEEYGYEIKYPKDFMTQVLAAGAGKQEASPNVRSLYIYEINSNESYLERYINIEYYQMEPSYSSNWLSEEFSNNNISGVKYTHPKNQFYVYHLTIPNKTGVLEIFVSKKPDQTELANRIFSTFKFVDGTQNSDLLFFRKSAQCDVVWAKSDDEIREYLIKEGIRVISLERRPDSSTAESICLSCDCEGGSIIIIRVENGSKGKLSEFMFQSLDTYYKTISRRCILVPDLGGTCKVKREGHYFDSQSKSCTSYISRSCSNDIPFKNAGECEKVCQ